MGYLRALSINLAIWGPKHRKHCETHACSNYPETIFVDHQPIPNDTPDPEINIIPVIGLYYGNLWYTDILWLVMKCDEQCATQYWYNDDRCDS